MLQLFKATLQSPLATRWRVVSAQPVGGGIIREEPARKGADVDAEAVIKCEQPLTRADRGKIASLLDQSSVGGAPAYPYFEWGLELLGQNGRIVNAIYMSTDWTNYDFAQAEIGGVKFEISKHLLKWIKARFPTRDCWFDPQLPRPVPVKTFQNAEDDLYREPK